MSDYIIVSRARRLREHKFVSSFNGSKSSFACTNLLHRAHIWPNIDEALEVLQAWVNSNASYYIKRYNIMTSPSQIQLRETQFGEVIFEAISLDQALVESVMSA